MAYERGMTELSKNKNRRGPQENVEEENEKVKWARYPTQIDAMTKLKKMQTIID